MDAKVLNHKGRDHDHQEKWVVEEVGEDVQFIRLQFSGVDFVEDLQ